VILDLTDSNGLRAGEGRRTDAPSNRSFGWRFTVFFALVGLYSLWREGTAYSWMLGLAGLTAAVTMVRPQWLAPLNRAWMRFGELLERVVSPLVLGIIFYGVFRPVGSVMRVARRDAMERRFEPGVQTYWAERDPPGPADDDFPEQF
jgi:hypothetical protein